MSLPPLVSLLIAAGLFILSIGIAGRMSGKFGRRTIATCLVLGSAVFVLGLFLHIRTPLQEAAPPTTSHAVPATPQPGFRFSPPSAHWGDEVELDVRPDGRDVTVYLNGIPLPVRLEGGKVRITVPSLAKTGYLEVEMEGGRLRSFDPLSVSP